MRTMEVEVSVTEGNYDISCGDWNMEISTSVIEAVVVCDEYIFLRHTKDGKYSSHDPDHGVASQGDTVKEARENLEEAIALYRQSTAP